MAKTTRRKNSGREATNEKTLKQVQLTDTCRGIAIRKRREQKNKLHNFNFADFSEVLHFANDLSSAGNCGTH